MNARGVPAGATTRRRPASGGAPAEAVSVADRVLSAATGTVLRPSTLRGYATKAGFTRIDTLPIDHDVWRFYQLHP